MTKQDYIARARREKARKWAAWFIAVLKPRSAREWRAAAFAARRTERDVYEEASVEAGAHPPSEDTRRIIAAEIGDAGMLALHRQ
jgi:hypothetical protein